MSTIVKKIRNISLYNIGQFESWLSDMAKKGLVLSKINFATCSFVKLECSNMEYRIEIYNHPMSMERIEVYKQYGWDYVCSFREVHVFCALVSDELLEMHSDPEEQSYTLKNITRKLRFCNIIFLSCIAFLIADNIFLLRIGNTPYINLLEHGWQICASSFVTIIMVIINLKQNYECMAIKKMLAMGKSINHHSDWKRGVRFNCAALCISILFCIFIMIETEYQLRAIIGYFNGRNSYNLTMGTELPILRLGKIEVCKGAILKEDPHADGFNGNNRVDKQNDLLLKEHYEVTETYYVADEIWNDSSDIYSPSLKTNYYEMSIPFFMNGVMKDLVHTAEKYSFDKSQSVIINQEGLDKVYYIEYGLGYFTIVARKDNKIIYLTYCGKQNYTKVLGALAESLK